MHSRNPATLLAAHRVLYCTDVRQFHAFVTSIEGSHQRRIDAKGPIELELRHLSLDQVKVAVHHANFRMTVEATRGPDRAYLLQFPLSGSFTVEVDGKALLVDADTGLILSPACRVRRTAEPGWTLVFALDRALVCARLAARLGRAPAQAPTFRPLVTAAAAEIREYGLMMVDAIDRAVLQPGKAMTAVMEAGLVDLLLAMQPHSHSTADAPDRSDPAARRIQAVTAHLHAHLDREFTIEKLAQVAKCSARALQTTFAEYCGMSPMDHVRRFRLARARELLESGADDLTVADVARRTGFAHLGRFAASYQLAYAERPSDTLRRAARRTHGGT